MSAKPRIRSSVNDFNETRAALAVSDAYLSTCVAKDVTISSTGSPTDAELDAAFGTPAQVGDGFHAILDEGGSGSVVYPVYAKNGKWWYGAALTVAS